MFASGRRLVHQTLHVSREINWRTLTPAGEQRYGRWDHYKLELRFLSFVGERDLLKYARHPNIRVEYTFSPKETLEPGLQYR